MDTVVLRPGNLYGPFDKFDWKESKVIAALIRRAIERHDPIIIWGDGSDIKDFLYIADFVEGALLAMSSNGSVKLFNIASGKATTIRDVLSLVLVAAEYEDAKLEYDVSKPTMIPKRMINVSRAEKILGWKPRTSLADGIKTTVNWFKEYANSFV